jgi:hypothetical protein
MELVLLAVLEMRNVENGAKYLCNAFCNIGFYSLVPLGRKLFYLL